MSSPFNDFFNGGQIDTATPTLGYKGSFSTKGGKTLNSINLKYIIAAVYENTGKKLTQKEMKRYLIEEGLITEAQANVILWKGYSYLHYPIDPVATEIEDKEPDLYDILKD